MLICSIGKQRVNKKSFFVRTVDYLVRVLLELHLIHLQNNPFVKSYDTMVGILVAIFAAVPFPILMQPI